MLELYNTMSRKKEVFSPMEDRKVKMFTCGPSIYQRPHLGNFRTFLYEDILQRYLEYLGYEVERVINFTDVEDKTITQARKEGTSLPDLTNRIADRFFEDAGLLRIKLPSFIPRSSTIVDQAVYLIQILLGKGYAYWHGQDVFYDPLRFKGFGRLYGLDMSRWPTKKMRFRKDTYPGDRWNLGDFILWRSCRKGDDPSWETEIGRGRPAWNVQDPAIITRHLGWRIDLSCGGIDNLYRHHDYTIAIAEAVSGQELAHYWLHGNHLLVDGKMSKSKGNIVYLDTLLKEGYSPQAVRFLLIHGQYREKMNLTQAGLKKMRGRFNSLQGVIGELIDAGFPDSKSDEAAEEMIGRLRSSFEENLDNDLDVRGALDSLRGILGELMALKEHGRLSRQDCMRIEQDMRKIDRVLQVFFP